MRRIAIALAVLAALAAADDDLARLFPADTFAYLEVDAGAVEQGLPEAQVMKILADPRLKTLLAPAFGQLGIDADKPVESILARLRVAELLSGRAAVGVRGISFTVHEAGGKVTSFRFAPGEPVDARAVYALFGLMTRAMDAAGREKLDIDVDFLAVGRPGGLGKRLLGEALESLGGEVTRTAVKVGGHDATHVRVDEPFLGYNFYAAERDGVWMLATQEDVLASALAGGPRTSLAASPSLRQARARLTSGRPLLLLHVDVALALETVKGCLPPVVVEMGDINGLNALHGVGFGVSLAEGGIRESVGVLLDGNPRGIWKLLEAMPPGLRSPEVAPPGALAAASVKFDPTALRDRWRSLVGEISPGNEDLFEKAIASEFLRETGVSLIDEILPALGDEAAVFLFPPRMGEWLPQAVLGFDAREEAAMSRLVAKLRERADPRDVSFAPAELPGGVAATRITARIPYDIHFAVHERHLFAATNAALLGEVFARWGAAGAKSLRRDDEVLGRVLAGACVEPDRMAMLAYVNLRAAGVEAVKVLPMLLGAAENLPGDWIDPKGLSELLRIPNHLTGMAITLSHDKDALVLDCFSPVGLIVPACAGTVVDQMARQRQRARRIAVVAAQPQGGASLGIATCATDGAGVTVLALAGGGPGVAGGLQPRDRVVALDGVGIRWVEDLKDVLGKRKPGDVVKVTVRRGDEEVILEIELGVAEGGGW